MQKLATHLKENTDARWSKTNKDGIWQILLPTELPEKYYLMSETKPRIETTQRYLHVKKEFLITIESPIDDLYNDKPYYT